MLTDVRTLKPHWRHHHQPPSESLTKSGGIVTIAVHIEGTYRFSQDELHQIKQLIAGKTQQQAIRILLGLPGIQGGIFDDHYN